MGIVKVLVAEDSRTARAWLRGLLLREGFEVVEVADGRSAVRATATERPDVVLMDLALPRLSGVEAIAEIMAACPTPIVVLSSHVDAGQVDLSFAALQAGALDTLAKPRTALSSERDAIGRTLVRRLRLMAGAKLVRRLPPPGRTRRPPPSPSSVDVMVIGASTGGPAVLYDLLLQLPPPSVPIVIVQHIGAEFAEGFARHLAGTGQDVVLATTGALRPGRVVVAPASGSLVFTAPGQIAIRPGWPPKGILPSIDATLSSLAVHHGDRAGAMLLTGMGKDGATGLLAVREAGGACFAQDEVSCVVFGMPRAAFELGAVDVLHSATELGEILKASAS